MIRIRHLLVVPVLICAALAGCAALNPSPTATESPTATPIPPTDTAQPSDTPAPTDAPEPSEAPEPTRTPRPTDRPDDDADNDNSGASQDEESDNQGSRSTPNASRGQGVGEGRDRGGGSGEVVELDVCTLLKAEEAADALGAEDEFESFSSQASCVFTSANPNADSYVSVSLTALQSAEAKWMLSVLLATLRLFSSSDVDQDIEDLIEEVQDEIEDMSVQEVIEELLLPLYEDFGFEVDEADDLGADAAYWLWYGESSADTGIGEMLVIRDDAYMMVDITGLEERDSEDAAAEMAEIALDRLPDRFSVLPDDYEDMLTPEP